MAVLNPPRSLPGLGRAMVNFLLESRSSWNEPQLIEELKPPGVNTGGSTEGIEDTLKAFRAIGMLESNADGSITVSDSVTVHGSNFGRDEFRRITLSHVLDLSRDGNPWAVGDGEASTSGARDLTRALSWFLAQDALGAPLSWNENVQRLQAVQFGAGPEVHRPFANDTRWGAFTRWTLALGLAVPSVVRGKSGLVPLPTVAVADVVAAMPAVRMPIQQFLSVLAQQLPMLPGGVIRTGLIDRLGSDPDPGTQANVVDTSVAQVLKILQLRGQLTFESLADADGVQLSRFDQGRITHVTLKGGNNR